MNSLKVNSGGYVSCTVCEKIDMPFNVFLHSQLNMPYRLIKEVISGLSPDGVGIYLAVQANEKRLFDNIDRTDGAIPELFEKLLEPNKTIVRYRLGLSSDDKLTMPIINASRDEISHILEFDSDYGKARLSPTVLNEAVLVSSNIFNALNFISLGYQSVMYDKNPNITDYQEKFKYNIILNDSDYINKIELERNALKIINRKPDIIKILKRRIPPVKLLTISRPVMKSIQSYRGKGSRMLLSFYLYVLANGSCFRKQQTCEFLGVGATTFTSLVKAICTLKEGNTSLCSITDPNILGVYYFRQAPTGELHGINFRVLDIIKDADAIAVYIYMHAMPGVVGFERICEQTGLSPNKAKLALNLLIDKKYVWKNDGENFEKIIQKVAILY
jgi:hypothetical protein